MIIVCKYQNDPYICVTKANNMTITTTNTSVTVQVGKSFGTYSNSSFAALLYNSQRIDRKCFEKMRRYMLTEQYATTLVNQNIDLFKNL